MNPTEHAPAWLLMPLPANAADDDALHARIDELAHKLPESIGVMHAALDAVKMYSEYEAAANRAAAHVWRALDRLFTSESASVRGALLSFASDHMVETARTRVFRRLMKDPSGTVRAKARRIVRRTGVREVALPLTPDGAWDAAGWQQGTTAGPLSRRPWGERIQTEHGVPPFRDLVALRHLLGVRSPRQLGYFLLASDKDDGPYTTFTIPKKDGTARVICAPKRQLRWVQRQILDKILAGVAPHDAAHGFVPGRSTVTNAAPHQGAALLLKFDLTDFFPTIHYYRVVGLFASLGYNAGDGRFTAADESTQVAPVLARLCCYTPDPRRWGNAVAPQGAPTSPALSNLVCRRLDARLRGLAGRNGGVYTRYADDLTFSFKTTALNVGRFRWWVDQICHQEGFFVNHRKFHVIRASQRQLVTGVVVNEELRVPRDERRRFRAVLHNCRKHGVESQARGRTRFREYLRGFASYVYMVHPDEGTELLREVEALLGPESERREDAP